MKKLADFFDSYFTILNLALTGAGALSLQLLNFDITEKQRLTYPIKSVILQHCIDLSFWSLLVLAFCILLLNIFNHRNKKSKKQLQDRIDKLEKNKSFFAQDVRNLFEGWLYAFSGKLNFSSEERVTLYIHDQNKNFIQVGRYSSHPNYKKIGRNQYPDNQGCISKAWYNEWHFDNSFDDNSNLRADRHVNTYGLNRKEINKLSMPSKLYAALRISDSSGNSLAVIVVESTNKTKYDEKTIKGNLTDQNVYLRELVTKLWDHIPKPSLLKDKDL